jgi:hypothetical protein
MHGAGATSGNAAAEFGARQVQFIAQHPQQGCAGVGSGGAALAVDVQLQVVSPVMEAGMLVQMNALLLAWWIRAG